CMIWHNNAYSF
nr:immunoglobulin light chain junction region [Macaca mulatta]